MNKYTFVQFQIQVRNRTVKNKAFFQKNLAKTENVSSSLENSRRKIGSSLIKKNIIWKKNKDQTSTTSWTH